MIIIRAKRVSGDVAGGGGAPTNDDDNDTDDCYFVGTATNFYYWHLKIVLSTVVLKRKSTKQPRTKLKRLTKRG